MLNYYEYREVVQMGLVRGDRRNDDSEVELLDQMDFHKLQPECVSTNFRFGDMSRQYITPIPHIPRTQSVRVEKSLGWVCRQGRRQYRQRVSSFSFEWDLCHLQLI